jgi:UDP-N-acetylmuramoyl-tripeptide--D-alanyl-D-alanine ligase
MLSHTLAGLAAATGGALHGADRGFSAVTTDTRKMTAGELFVALNGPNFDGHNFVATAAAGGAAGALVQRYLPMALSQVLVSNTRRALGRYAAHWRSRFAIPLIGVTGSNGKTTVKEMIAAILRRRGLALATQGNLNNDIGVPLTLLRLEDTHTGAVVEMGTNHPGEIAYLAGLARPTVGVITNAGSAHLEALGDVAGVAREKGALFAGLAADGTAVINADDTYAPLWRELKGERRAFEFGSSRAADFSLAPGSRQSGAQGQRFRMTTPAGEATIELPLPGEHNAMNALAAAASAWAAGASLAEIVAGLGEVAAVAGRLQAMAGPNGSRLIDDSYNANPGSLAAALAVAAASTTSLWLVLGDMGELGPAAPALHAEAGRRARELGIERLLAVGELSREAVRAFGAGAQHFATLPALLEALQGELSANVTVLIKGSRSMRLERVAAALAAPAEGGPCCSI